MATGAARAVVIHGSPSPAAAAPARRTVRRESRPDGLLVLVMRKPLCLPDGRGVGDDRSDYAGKRCGGSARAEWEDFMSKKRIQPKGLFQRKLKDHVLY